MLLQVQNIDALDLCDAATKGDVDRVESLLASGVDPNARWEYYDFASSPAAVEHDWASREKSARPPIVFSDRTMGPALRCASQMEYMYPDKQKASHIMTALLQHGADPYGLFMQPIHTYRELPLFPGKKEDSQYRGEESDLMHRMIHRGNIIDKKVQLHHRDKRLAQGMPAHKADKYLTFDEDEYDDAADWEPETPLKYGAYSVLHSLLEDGSFIWPILDFLGDKLDIDRRDPQGRTLFLSACRGTLGLDVSIDGTYRGLHRCNEFRGIYENPYLQPDNPWREFECDGSTRLGTGPSLLDYFVSRGANLLAVDNYGKNALHQLFECIDRVEQSIPGIIDDGLRYLTNNCRVLVNQPDHAGSYPLHLAIRRMGACWHRDWFVPAAIFKFETAVEELLAAGADPHTRDGFGNTVLHYLAATRLGSINRMGNEERRLLHVFLDEVRVDVTARNATGASALEIFLSTGDDDHFGEDWDIDEWKAIGEEVIGAFEQAGYNLTETNWEGQTLLHVVATSISRRGYEWFHILQARGLDPMVRDKEGETAHDIVDKNERLRRTFRLRGGRPS